MTAGVVAGLRQLEFELLRLGLQKGVRDLDQNARAVTGDRIGADRPAVFEVLQNAERVFDQLVGLAAFEVGNKADATGIVFAAGIEQTARLGKKGHGTGIRTAAAVGSIRRHRRYALWLRWPHRSAGGLRAGTLSVPRNWAWAASSRARGAGRHWSVAPS